MTLQRSLLATSLIGGTLLLSACGGNGHKPTPTVDLTAVRVIHASADAPKVKIAVDAGLAEGVKTTPTWKIPPLSAAMLARWI